MLVTGVATNVCVGSTARDAVQSGYRVFFVRDCTATRSAAATHATEVTIHKSFGAVVDSATVIAVWQPVVTAAALASAEPPPPPRR